MDHRVFERQMQLIRAEADVVPLMTLLNNPDERDRLVAITFDDAYQSALLYGVGTCRRLDIPCTVFVSPALLGGVPQWDVRSERQTWTPDARASFLTRELGIGDAERECPPEWEVLRIGSEQELAAAVAGGSLRLGNHTYRHANLEALDRQTAVTEIVQADKWLSERFAQHYDRVIAFPYGLGPSDAPAVLSQSAMLWGLAVTGGWIRQRIDHPPLPWSVPRWNVPAGISINGFRLRMRGWFH
jgi:peptidoglycan/xylan/chitin deacetylase (PgdA/CDA1 family)